MKYIPLPKFDAIDNALNFYRDGLEVEGSCDIFTLKSTKADKRLKKTIDAQIAQRHQQDLQMAASLSPPAAVQWASSTNLSQSSSFGNLSQASNRRTYANLIGILNACHPDYDLSNVLRPNDFRRERNLQDVIDDVDEKILGLRQNYWQTGIMPTRSKTKWGYEKWKIIDEEMDLGDCQVYNFCPNDSPFDGDGIPIWSCHYFFFNRNKKRVCYIQIRAIDPSYNDDVEEDDAIYDMDSLNDQGAKKRASYWLGDRQASIAFDRQASFSEDDHIRVNIENVLRLAKHAKENPTIRKDILEGYERERQQHTESAIEDSSDRTSTPGSSDDDSDGLLKPIKSRFARRKGSDRRAMSTEVAESIEL